MTDYRNRANDSQKHISFFQKFERERIFLMMDKAKDDKVSLEEFKQFFQKMSASDRNTLTEFLFRIFDTKGMNHTI